MDGHSLSNMAKRRTDKGQTLAGKGQAPLVQRLLGWLLLCVFMFTVGVLVGRGTAPVQFDVPSIQAHLKSLRDKAYEEAVKYYKIENGAPEDKTSLKYREALRTPADLDNDIQVAPKSSKKPATPSLPSKPTAPEKNAESGIYLLQIASMKDGEAAEALAEKIRKRGYSAYSEPVEISEKGTWYRVRIGDYPDSRSVEKVQAALGQIGREALVIRK